jgi:Na+-driven multidrug efflux pump
MYFLLSVAAALIALLVTGFGIFAAYMLWSGKREAFNQALRRWTIFDYLIVSVFVIGTLFLLTDLIAVMKDREAYPYYHYGYLVSGFVYNVLAGVFLYVRLGMTFRLLGADGAAEAEREAAAADSSGTASDNNHREPDETKRAEQRV